ncbi:MAG: TolC family protein [Bacteroidota bacterium]
MLNTVHKIIAVHLLLVLPLLVAAQDPVLDAYIALALEQNPAIQASRLVENARAITVELAAANRRVSVDLKSDYLLSAGGRRIALPIGDLFNPTYATLNQLTASEQFPTDLENVNERFIPSNFHDTRVEATLPLLQPLIGREVALREAQAREATFATKVVENSVRQQVRDLYYVHQQSLEGQRIIDSSRVVLEEVLRVNRVLVENDKVTADAISRTEAELAALAGQAAALRQQEALAAAALNRLLNRELTTPLEAFGGTTAEPSPALLSQLSTRARAQRPELQQIDAGTQSLLRLEELQDAGRRPTLGLQATAGAQGFLGGDLSDHPYGISASAST